MSDPMALRATTVRFAQDAMDLVQDAAREAGCSLSQFVREAAIMRAAHQLKDRPELGDVSPDIEHLARNYDED